MTSLSRLACGAAALALSAGALCATPAAASASAPCFFTNQWQGWKAPDPRTLYLRVNSHDVYRVDLTGETSMLQSPGVHLVFKGRGSSICGPLDLDLAVSDGHGFNTPLIARSLTKLTPEEVAAIPRKYQP